MSAPFDPTADFAVADGSEPITLYRRGVTPGSSGAIVAHALRRGMSVREAANSKGLCTASDVVWHLPVAELPDPPHLGDVIADADAGRWTVLEVQLVALRTRWRCVARSLAIVHGLDDTVTILKAAYAKSSGGAVQTTWQTWKTGVRARIQPAARALSGERPARQTAQRVQVFLLENLALNQNHRIQGPDGAVYKIVGITGAQQIAEPQTIEAEAVDDRQ